MSEREDRVREILSGPMPTVAFVQYGPDGTVALNVVTMYVCPMCGSCIPVPIEEHPEWAFPDWHIEHHLYVARQEDTLDALREEVRVMASGKPVYNPAYDLPHSRACGISRHEHGVACHSNCPTCGGKVGGITQPANEGD